MFPVIGGREHDFSFARFAGGNTIVNFMKENSSKEIIR